MIEILPQSHDNIIGVKASGKVTAADYTDVIIPAMDRMLADHDKARFVYYLSDEFEGFEVGAMWDDIKYAGGHHEKFDKIALVGGPRWIDWTTKIVGHFMKDTEVRTFEGDQLDEAWQWVEA